jgi:hypothetical protein
MERTGASIAVASPDVDRRRKPIATAAGTARAGLTAYDAVGAR